MFEWAGSGIIGSIFGGLFRLAPEILNFFDRKNERSHELEMFRLQTDLEKIKGDYKLEERYVDYSVHQVDAIAEVMKMESEGLKVSPKWVVALNMMVRPTISLVMFLFYLVVKASYIISGWVQNIEWTALISMTWTTDDFAILMMILTFHFVGRSIEKYKK